MWKCRWKGRSVITEVGGRMDGKNGRGLRHVYGNFASIFKITFEISVRNVIGNLVAMGT
jgi:hypothetical protein